MYKLCKTEQSARRQRELEQGLLQAMLQCRYEDISISELCDQLNIPRKSFYRYFSSKDGALYALLDHTMIDFLDSSAGGVGLNPGTHTSDLHNYFCFWRDHGLLLDALQYNGLGGILVQRAMGLALQERLMPGCLLNYEPEIQQLALSFSVSGLLSMVLQWHSQGFRTPAREMTRIAVEILTKPLLQT